MEPKQQFGMLDKALFRFLASKSIIIYMAFPPYFLLEVTYLESFWSGAISIFLACILLVVGVIFLRVSTVPHVSKSLIFVHIIGVFSIFLPFLFASFYVFAERFYGNCIKGLAGPFDPLYFSYVTLTTTGYGDLVPLGLCRSIAVVEAILGYICLGLLTAFFFTLFAQWISQGEKR